MEKPLRSFKISNKKDTVWWLIFAGLIIFEYLLFRSYVLREIAPYYPTNSDQTIVLSNSYLLFESILNTGFFESFKNLYTLLNLHWNTGITVIFPGQAAIFFLLFGASRLSALSINFIYFIVLQLVGAKTIKSLSSNNYYLPFLFVGLLLTTLSPLQDPGGLVDFRLDFIAFCLYGIFAISALKSQIFLDRKWSIIAMLLAVTTISVRLITLTYIIPILSVWLIYLILYRLHTPKKELTSIIKTQINNILISLGGIVSICVLFIYLLRKNIYNYYIIGHLTGNEKYVRSQIEGINGTISNLLYYPKSLIFHHLGTITITLFVILLSLLFFTFLITKKPTKNKNQQLLFFKQKIFFLFNCIFIPIIILTTDLSKSPIVGGIVVVPLLLAITIIVLFLYQNSVNVIFKKISLITFTIISLLFGLSNYLNHFGRHNQAYFRQNTLKLTKMYCDIGNYAIKKHWGSFSMMVDQVNDYLNDGALKTIYYEKTGVFLNVSGTPKLSTDITNIEKAKRQLNKNYIFITNLDRYKQELPYPYNVSISPLRSQLKQYAKKKFIVLGDYPLTGYRFRVYVKPTLPQ